MSGTYLAELDNLACAELHDLSLSVMGGLDINEHLDFLYRLASTVSHITEFGSRAGSSTCALILGRPKRLVSYDISRHDNMDKLVRLAPLIGVDYEFRNADVRTASIDVTDLLFIDTWHVEEQMRTELHRHSGRVRRYIVMHDTVTFGERGETDGHRGIWYAVDGFLATHPEWKVLHHFPNNNGLTGTVSR